MQKQIVCLLLLALVYCSAWTPKHKAKAKLNLPRFRRAEACSPDGKRKEDDASMMCCKGEWAALESDACKGVTAIDENSLDDEDIPTLVVEISKAHQDHLTMLVHQLNTYVKPLFAAYLDGKDTASSGFVPMWVEGTLPILYMVGLDVFYDSMHRMPTDIDIGTVAANFGTWMTDLEPLCQSPRAPSLFGFYGCIKWTSQEKKDKVTLDVHNHHAGLFAADKNAGVKWCDCGGAVAGVPFMPKATLLALYKQHAKGIRVEKDAMKIRLLEGIQTGPCGLCTPKP
jgi:hypothetical protein